MKSVTTVLALLILTLSGALHAAEPGLKDDWLKGKLFGPEVVLKHQSKLKLTDKQRDAIGAELKRTQAQAAESDWAILTEVSTLQDLIEQHPVDSKAAMGRFERIFAAENRKKQLYLEMLINIKNVLTAEQVAYLKSVSE